MSGEKKLFYKGLSGVKHHMLVAHKMRITEEYILLCHTENRYTTEQIFHLNTGGPLAPAIEHVV
jgi:hypothetical protein